MIQILLYQLWRKAMLLPWLLFQHMGLPQLVTLHFKIRGLILHDGNSPLLPHRATRLHLRLSVNWFVSLTIVSFFLMYLCFHCMFK
ncbi:hypothetical protein ZEAMMB73_Zm00001d015498 [Zea mays]|uniref:Uncharacterized protein n=1 Tax=Zea mays TaxID=4577 RepID=A0A1D6H2G4_MAIZE|nr:hypothetical protein ZEAMMB73_Zm00001d015498 [Zea mays]